MSGTHWEHDRNKINPTPNYPPPKWKKNVGEEKR